MTNWNGTRWVPEAAAPPPRPRLGGRLLGAGVEALLVVTLVFGLIASTAMAAKPNASQVWITELRTSARADMGLGDAFTVGYQSREREPFARAWCIPNDTTEHTGTYADGSVWAAVFSVYPGGPTPQNFVLGESVYPLWVGGGADCHVALVKYSRDLGRMTVLATTSFSAAP